MERDTILIPITVLQYFTPVERIDPMYVQVRSPQEVDRVAMRVARRFWRRGTGRARGYRVDTLTAILNAAKNISLILSLVLVLVSAITLMISGIGIMNIMLVTVTERTREIGVRLAVGASPKEILLQFLTEAMMVSLSGGVIGILCRGRDSAQRAVIRRYPDSHFAGGHRGGVRRLVPGGAGLRDSAGQSRRASESDRSVALRVSLLVRDTLFPAAGHIICANSGRQNELAARDTNSVPPAQHARFDRFVAVALDCKASIILSLHDHVDAILADSDLWGYPVTAFREFIVYIALEWGLTKLALVLYTRLILREGGCEVFDEAASPLVCLAQVLQLH